MSPLVSTALAMLAFAGNSLLCRAALVAGQIDPATFTLIRMVSGAIALSLIVMVQYRGQINPFASPRVVVHAPSGEIGVRRVIPLLVQWLAPMYLLAYAVFFSLAYVQLNAAVGALLLFVSVQMSMLIWTVLRGERLRRSAVAFLALALCGVVLLLWPNLEAPSGWLASGSMVLAGISWAAYSVAGQKSTRPLVDTALNFQRAGVVMVLIWLAILSGTWMGLHLPGVTVLQGDVFQEVYLPKPTWLGVLLALVSGVVASGIGYSIWYSALPKLKTTDAAVVQLSVPFIAAVLGVMLLGEPLTLRLILALVMTLGGIYGVLRVGRLA